MINYDSMCNLSSGVICNWCIQLDAPQSIASPSESGIVEYGDNDWSLRI